MSAVGAQAPTGLLVIGLNTAGPVPLPFDADELVREATVSILEIVRTEVE